MDLEKVDDELLIKFAKNLLKIEYLQMETGELKKNILEQSRVDGLESTKQKE